MAFRGAASRASTHRLACYLDTLLAMGQWDFLTAGACISAYSIWHHQHIANDKLSGKICFFINMTEWAASPTPSRVISPVAPRCLSYRDKNFFGRVSCETKLELAFQSTLSNKYHHVISPLITTYSPSPVTYHHGHTSSTTI